jgi:poly(A) polymerase
MSLSSTSYIFNNLKDNPLYVFEIVEKVTLGKITLSSKEVEAIKQTTPKLLDESVDAIRNSISKLLVSPFPHRAIKNLIALGVSKTILPEVDALANVEQPPLYHPEGDVLTHTLLLLEHMAYPTVLLGWTALLHDIGKPATQSFDKDGRIRFFSHEVVGAQIAETILKRFNFPNNEIEIITTAIRNHMKMANVVDMKKQKKLKIISSPTFALELELNRLDCIACHGKFDSFLLLLNEYRNQEIPAKTPPLITGKILLKNGFIPGPKLGKILSLVYDIQIKDNITSFDEALKIAKEISNKVDLQVQ